MKLKIANQFSHMSINSIDDIGSQDIQFLIELINIMVTLIDNIQF
jgi:hypothetical protein